MHVDSVDVVLEQHVVEFGDPSFGVVYGVEIFMSSVLWSVVGEAVEAKHVPIYYCKISIIIATLQKSITIMNAYHISRNEVQLLQQFVGLVLLHALEIAQTPGKFNRLLDFSNFLVVATQEEQTLSKLLVV